MLLLTEGVSGHRALLVEVKVAANTPWFAAVENLRQLRLYISSPAAQRILRKRRPSAALPDPLPVSGVVLAPSAYYATPVQKAASVEPAGALLARARANLDVTCGALFSQRDLDLSGD